MSKSGVLPQNGVYSDPHPGGERHEDAFAFVFKFTSLIVAVLSCFDRVIFKGYLPIADGQGPRRVRRPVLKIRRCDFMAFAEKQAEAFVDYAKRTGPEAGAEYRFLQGPHRKDKLVDEILRKRPIREG